MAHNHNHDHNHEHQHEVITLVDENGNETLFEILLTIDGREEFGKNYVLLILQVRKKTNKVKLRFKLTHLQKMPMELKETFSLYQKIQMQNGT